MLSFGFFRGEYVSARRPGRAGSTRGSRSSPCGSTGGNLRLDLPLEEVVTAPVSRRSRRESGTARPSGPHREVAHPDRADRPPASTGARGRNPSLKGPGPTGSASGPGTGRSSARRAAAGSPGTPLDVPLPHVVPATFVATTSGPGRLPDRLPDDLLGVPLPVHLAVSTRSAPSSADRTIARPQSRSFTSVPSSFARLPQPEADPGGSDAALPQGERSSGRDAGRAIKVQTPRMRGDGCVAGDDRPPPALVSNKTTQTGDR